MQSVYLDHAATTQMNSEVLEAMIPYYSNDFQNPSAGYQSGVKIRRKIEETRELIAECIHSEPDEIYFTSGGTESDNWILNSYAKKHIVTSTIEHHAILNTCHALESKGCKITYLPVNHHGRVLLSDVEKVLKEPVDLISVMYANNEIGTMQPIQEIGKIAEKYRVPFHTDAVQACGHVPIDVKQLKISAMSASAHKFNGPKGIGFLYVKQGMKIKPLLYGGGQEKGIRAGTENTAGIIGMGKALKIACDSMEQRRCREQYLRDYLIRRIMQEIPDVYINGHMLYRLPNNVNVSFRFVNGSSLFVLLDSEDICVSSGSACNSAHEGPSHVISALQVPEEYQNGVIRMTLGAENTIEELDRVVDILKNKIDELRKESPEYEDYHSNHSSHV